MVLVIQQFLLIQQTFMHVMLLMGPGYLQVNQVMVKIISVLLLGRIIMLMNLEMNTVQLLQIQLGVLQLNVKQQVKLVLIMEFKMFAVQV